MEKKKLLLVAVSVGVFLVIIISACILIFSPKNNAGNVTQAAYAGGQSGNTARRGQPIAAGTSGNPAQGNPAAPQLPATMDAADMVRNSGSLQGIQSPPSATAIQETNFYINGAQQPAENYRVDSGDPSRVVFTVPKPSTAAVPDVDARPQAVQQATPKPAAPKQTAPVQAKPAVPAAPKQAAPKPAVAAKTSSESNPAAKTYNDYWVQTGAFTSLANAQGVKEKLASKGIASIIDNSEVDGKVWHRVRMGPYTSENEAKYWLTFVKEIDGFGNSQIRQTRSTR